MDRGDMEKRTFEFAKCVVKLSTTLPLSSAGHVLSKQVLRSGTAVGANYREALRASSRRHFITTLEIAQREAAETQYWLELLIDTRLIPRQRAIKLLQECTELLAILTATIRTAKQKADAR